MLDLCGNWKDGVEGGCEFRLVDRVSRRLADTFDKVITMRVFDYVVEPETPLVGAKTGVAVDAEDVVAAPSPMAV